MKLDRRMNSCKDRDKGRQIDRWVDGQIDSKEGRQLGRQIDSQEDRQIDRKIDRQLRRQIDSQEDIQIVRKIDRQVVRQISMEKDIQRVCYTKIQKELVINLTSQTRSKSMMIVASQKLLSYTNSKKENLHKIFNMILIYEFIDMIA